MVPPILEISASQEDGIIPEIKISKPGQPDSASSEKKFNKLSLSKRKKEPRKYNPIYFDISSTYSMKLGNRTMGILKIFSPRLKTNEL